MSLSGYCITPLGDSALLIHFGNVMDESINNKILSIFRALKSSNLPLVDVVPAYASLAVYYDVMVWRRENATAYDAVREAVEPFLQTGDDEEAIGAFFRLPVCYAPDFAPDLKELAERTGLSPEEVITIHTTATYRVYMIGFLPGFAYMGKVDGRIATPRRQQPRLSIPAGSVGIAGMQTGVYPLASPGGWNIIGRTTVPMFYKGSNHPVLLKPGDFVQFFSITPDEFAYYQNRLA